MTLGNKNINIMYNSTLPSQMHFKKHILNSSRVDNEENMKRLLRDQREGFRNVRTFIMQIKDIKQQGNNLKWLN